MYETKDVVSGGGLIEDDHTTTANGRSGGSGGVYRATTTENAWRITNVGERMKESAVDLPWRVKPMALDGMLTVFAGSAGLGKTQFTMALADGVTLGQNVGGCRCEQGKVLYFDGEMGWNWYRRYAETLNLSHDVQHIEAGGLNLNDATHLAWIESVIQEFDGRFVILDSLRTLTPDVDENVSNHMAPLLTSIRAVARRTDAALMLIHHSGKEEGNDSRGSSGIVDQCEALFAMRDGGENVRTIIRKKTRFQAPNSFAVAWDQEAGVYVATETHSKPKQKEVEQQIVNRLKTQREATKKAIANAIGREDDDPTFKKAMTSLVARKTIANDENGWHVPPPKSAINGMDW
jgi:RecA-family ATPase